MFFYTLFNKSCLDEIHIYNNEIILASTDFYLLHVEWGRDMRVHLMAYVYAFSQKWYTDSKVRSSCSESSS